MDGFLDWFLRAIFLYPFELIYSHEWVPPFVLMPIMFGIAWHIQRRERKKTLPFIASAMERVVAIENLIGPDSSPETDRQKFAENYFVISAVMNASGAAAKPLIEAWREFTETCLFDEGKVVQNTARPSTFFMRVVPRQTALTFASNIFVGAGLILTFVGLIVALNTAAAGMGGDTAHAQDSLTKLLTVAGAKFFTSVSGIGASIWLRCIEHSLTSNSIAPVSRISELLERCLLYVSPQKLASDQLAVMKEQRDQLKTFNTDFALQLSERIGIEFQNVMTPMAQSLDNLNANMTSVTQGIGAGAKEAIEKVSGDQLRGLADTLASLRDKLDGIATKVDASGSDAAAQINAAGEKFSQAADGIQSAFDKLTGNVDNLGSKLSQRGEEAAKVQNEAMVRMLTGLEKSQMQVAESMKAAVAGLHNAGKQVATDMQDNLGKVLSENAKHNHDLVKAAIEESSKGLSEAIAELSDAIEDAATDINDAGTKFERSGEGANRSATALTQVATSAEQVTMALRNAATGIAEASNPMVQAARSTAETAGKIATSIEMYSASQARALDEMKELASGVKQTNAAAEGAWRDYRGRFEGVDQMLSKTMDTMATQLSACLTDFRRFAQETDRELANAVSKLSLATAPIEEYAGSLDDFVETLRNNKLESAR